MTLSLIKSRTKFRAAEQKETPQLEVKCFKLKRKKQRNLDLKSVSCFQEKEKEEKATQQVKMSLAYKNRLKYNFTANREHIIV